MAQSISRRQFVKSATALSAAAFLPTSSTASSTSSTQKVEIWVDDEIGLVRPDLHGQFAEHLGSCVYGGLWVGKNSPIPNIQGYRKQAVEYLRDLGVPVLRWPGGCFADDYHWRDGIGPLSQRPRTVNIHWGGNVEDNSFGTHEFVGLCRLIGAEPYFAGNVGSGSPRELRDWIEYCNYPAGSTLSDERVTNGSKEPFNIRYWGIGNENWGCGGDMRPEEYAHLFRDFSVYTHGFGDTRIFRVACGPSGDDLHWSHGLLDGIRENLPDGLSMHYYSGGQDYSTTFTPEHMDAQLASYAKVEEAIVQQRAVLDSYRGGPKVALILDEWGVWDRISEEDEKRYGALWQQSTMRSAVAAGLGLNIFNRQADKLYMCNIAQIVNVLQSMLLTDGPEGRQCVRTTSYYAFLLFKPHRSKTAVRVENSDSSPLGLSVSASKSDKELVVSLVNPHYDRDLHVDCVVKGSRARSGTAQILHNGDWNACNSFTNPDAVVPRQHAIGVDANGIHVDVPRMSVITATMQTA